MPRSLRRAPDVQAFGKNYMAVGFKLEYVKANGELSTYTPDFIVRTTDGGVWIVETKGPRGTRPAAEDGAPASMVRGRHRGHQGRRRPELRLRLCRSGKLREAQAVVICGAGERVPRIPRGLTMARQDKKSYELSDAEQRDLIDAHPAGQSPAGEIPLHPVRG